MRSTHTRLAIVITLLASLAAVPAVTQAATASEHRVVDGVSIYLGIMPAEILRGHQRGHPESEMHGGPPAGGHVYHLIIALFDQQTDKRISDARVSASIAEINHPGHQRKLEPMLIAGTVAYGNYFDLAGSGPYRIVVQIRRPGQPGVIEAEFVFEHARA
jgi:hypothetical protein